MNFDGEKRRNYQRNFGSIPHFIYEEKNTNSGSYASGKKMVRESFLSFCISTGQAPQAIRKG